MTIASRATVVVCDASTDGDRVRAALRGAGHIALEAFPQKLLACVRESGARVVVIDADNEGCFAAFRSLREDPSFSGVDVLLVSEKRVIDRDGAMDLGASGLFARPVDDAQVVRKVNSLTSGTPSGEIVALTPSVIRTLERETVNKVDQVSSLAPLPDELLRLLTQPIVEDSEPDSTEDRSPVATPALMSRESRSPSREPHAETEPSKVARTFSMTSSIHHRLGASIAERESGSFVVRAGDEEWSTALREGDLVAIASSAAECSFVSFLVMRGVVARASRASLLDQVPSYGSRAAIAAVALGLLQPNEAQDYLADHADWLLSRFVALPEFAESSFVSTQAIEPYLTAMVPFAARDGAALFVEAHRRALEPDRAFDVLRGDFILARGPNDRLLSLATADEQEALRRLFERPLVEVPLDLRPLLVALERLGGLRFVPRLAPSHTAPEPTAVIRARIAARSELVKEGDYFALLGVGSEASGHEIRRAYLELRRTLEPARLPLELQELHDDVQTIVEILDEAYDVLRDNGRRERYRRAIAKSVSE